MHMMPYYWNGYNNGYMIWGFVFMFLMMALVIIGVIVAFRYLVHASNPTARTNAAVDILKKRYAQGEINKQEYEEKLKDLSA